MLKAVALYLDGSKLAQPLNSVSDERRKPRRPTWRRWPST
jgi:hypothetical protein